MLMFMSDLDLMSNDLEGLLGAEDIGRGKSKSKDKHKTYDRDVPLLEDARFTKSINTVPATKPKKRKAQKRFYKKYHAPTVSEAKAKDFTIPDHTSKDPFYQEQLRAFRQRMATRGIAV